MIVVHNILFPAALQMQQSVAAARNINLLVAGASRPQTGSTGSGIYSGTLGALNALIVDTSTPTTRVLLSEISKEPGVSGTAPTTLPHRVYDVFERDHLKLKYENLSDYNVQWLNFEVKTKQIGRICHNRVCCNYVIQVVVPDRPIPSVSYIRTGMTTDACRPINQKFWCSDPSLPAAILLLRDRSLRWCELNS